MLSYRCSSTVEINDIFELGIIAFSVLVHASLLLLA